MASIEISRTHHLSHDKAKDVAEKIARDLNRRFDLAWQWDGDHIAFERSGVHGTLHVGSEALRLEATLGFLLSALKPGIEREIHAQLDKLVPAAPKGAAKPAKAGKSSRG